MANKISFTENLAKIKDVEQPFSTAALSALSNMEANDQTAFEAAWPQLPLERQRRIAATLAGLAEDDIELDFAIPFYFMLSDPDAQVRGKAIEGLWEDESREFMSKLLLLLASDPDEGVREKAALGLSRFAYLAELGKIKQNRAARLRESLLEQCRGDFEPIMVSRRALEALGYFGQDEQVLKTIERAYANDDELLRASALKAMGRSINKRWLPEVGKELSSEDPALRYEAATAAGEMGSDELLQPLIALLDDPDREVLMAVIWSLGQIGGPEANRVLKELSTSEEESIATAASDALAEITYASNPLNVLS